MKSNIPISVIVSVKNEEINLPYCLEKLKPFSEVLVVDSMSADRTAQIVNDFGYRLVNFVWNGKFPKKRNWALKNIYLKHEWVLFLDADEFLTTAFIDEVSNKIISSDYSGFWLYYNNYFMGKEIRHGDKMKKLALFKKGSGEYERVEEDLWSHLDMEVHEHPIIKGEISEINSPIIHKDYKGLEHYIQRHNAYSSWEAHRYLQLSNVEKSTLTSRQKLKYKLISWGILPTAYFLGSYIFKLGFLDGRAGYYLAKYKANYFFQIQTKIKELKIKK
jgi:glycosyltransferase involved in cell wall biosynthesis